MRFFYWVLTLITVVLRVLVIFSPILFNKVSHESNTSQFDNAVHFVFGTLLWSLVTFIALFHRELTYVLTSGPDLTYRYTAQELGQIEDEFDPFTPGTLTYISNELLNDYVNDDKHY